MSDDDQRNRGPTRRTTGVWLGLGIGVGAALGAAMGSLAWGVGTGAAVGLILARQRARGRDGGLWGIALLAMIPALSLGLSRQAMAQEGPPDDLDGRWEGAIRVAGQTIDFALVSTAATDSIDIEIQGSVVRLSIEHDHPRVRFEIPAGPGLASFAGQHDGSTISGTFLQAGVEGTFRLERLEDGETRAPEQSAPDSATSGPPHPAPPYHEHAVTVEHGGLALAGTLTVPGSAGPHPALVLVSGSGPQDRDATVAGMKPFALLADALARAGFATLRLDDRGVGGSRGSTLDARFADTKADLEAALGFLGSQPSLDPGRIGVLGHSEGALLAAMLASDDGGSRDRSLDVATGEAVPEEKNVRSAILPAFAVMLAGPAVPIEDLLHAQADLILVTEGFDVQSRRQQRELRELIFEAVRSGVGWEAARVALERQVRLGLDRLGPEALASVPDVDAMVAAEVEQQVAASRTPWFKELLDFDPTPFLSRVRVPILAVYGEKDLQVPPDPNVMALRKALPNSAVNYRVVVLDGANHLFQAAHTGSPAEYAELAPRFVSSLIPELVGWLTEVARP